MLIRVQVFPGSNKEEVIKKANGGFEVQVRARAERGLANQAVIGVLAVYFKIPASKIRLVKGFTRRNKIFNIHDS